MAQSRLPDPIRFLTEAHMTCGPIMRGFQHRDEPDLAGALDERFGSARWRDTGYSFTLLGADEGGGLYLAWFRPEDRGGEPAVVWVGDRERTSLIAPGVWALAELLAQGYSWSWDHDRFMGAAVDELLEGFHGFASSVRRTLPWQLRPPVDILAEVRRSPVNFSAWVAQHAG